MTDVFISYARDDRERVRPVAEALQAEGWDVWWDPSQPMAGATESVDRKLASAGAVLVMWSAAARGSEYVRSEAATGLYRNKLIQARIDTAAPPRPFDQIEVMDIGHWSGERDDPQWRRIVGTVKLFAGAPGSQRPTVMRKAGAPNSAGGKVGYLEAQRSIALAPILAVVAVAIAGGGLFFVDPFNWRSPAPLRVASLTARMTPEPSEADLAHPVTTASSPETQAAWERLNRTDPEAVRSFMAEHAGTSEADSAKSALRVLDAQAWASAVTIDTVEAYTAYLTSFPADASIPGAMTSGAAERLVSLEAERSQAIADIQRALTSLGIYKGHVDGKTSPETSLAARAFVSSHGGKSAPDLAKAAPRDLRSFADTVEGETAAGSTPQARADAAARKAADVEADRKRREEATAAQTLAKRNADAMAQAELQRQADLRAAAEVAAAAAEASKPKADPFSPELAPAAVRQAVAAARTAATQANARASAARQAAADADKLAADAGTNDIQAITAADGDRYVAQVRDGTPNGLGVRVSGDATSAGDRYRGELRNGLGSGLGVYEFGNNPNNQAAGALRYEGEHARDSASGLGVTYWKNGDRFAGNDSGAASRGVMMFTDGRRYEGELNNGVRSGMGVLWNADGSVAMAGRWDNGQLVEAARGD